MRRRPTSLAIALFSALACGGGPAAPAPGEATAAAVPGSDPAALLATANEREAAGDLPAALARAEEALANGGGREAALTVAKLAIRLEQYDRALAVLQPLVDADPKDAIAQYDRALVFHRKDDYNAARSGYLAALRADPKHADARFNLAMLCWKQGVAAEAQHHAEKFRASFPDDPRGAELSTMMGAAPP